MMQALDTKNAVARAYAYSTFLAVIWLVAANLRPGTTYHLAPLLVAGAVPFVMAADEARINTGRLVTAALEGAALALVGTIILTVGGRLEGPSLLPFGGAVTESVVFAVAGAALGLTGAFVRRRN